MIIMDEALSSRSTGGGHHDNGSKKLLQRVILYRHKKILCRQGMASNIRAKLYINLRWLFDDISGLISSFGISSFVNLDMINLLPWIAAGSSRKSI